MMQFCFAAVATGGRYEPRRLRTAAVTSRDREEAESAVIETAVVMSQKELG
jgi:hypothetical protein